MIDLDQIEGPLDWYGSGAAEHYAQEPRDKSAEMLGAYAEWAVSALLAGEERRARELMSAAIACARAHCSSWKYHGAERAIHETRR